MLLLGVALGFYEFKNILTFTEKRLQGVLDLSGCLGPRKTSVAAIEFIQALYDNAEQIGVEKQ